MDHTATLQTKPLPALFVSLKLLLKGKLFSGGAEESFVDLFCGPFAASDGFFGDQVLILLEDVRLSGSTVGFPHAEVDYVFVPVFTGKWVVLD